MTLGKFSGAFGALAVVTALLTPGAALSQETPPPPPAEMAQAAPAPIPAPAPKPFEEIIKLWKGNLSEEFIKRKIESEAVIYQLSADDIVLSKAANLPESIIEAMMKTAQRPGATPAVTAPVAPVPAPAAAPAAAPVAPVDLAAQADRSWEGLVRRNDGIVLFKSRWDDGKLSFKEEKLSWLDARDEKKNLILPAKSIKEQFLVCLKGAPSEQTECFEWGVKTENGEYRFRDVGWKRSDSTKPQELFDFMKAIYPNLVSSEYPADEK
ncbi:MAG: hypothetical protein ACYC4P_19780 [Thermoanaerobaculia bacterium]